MPNTHELLARLRTIAIPETSQAGSNNSIKGGLRNDQRPQHKTTPQTSKQPGLAPIPARKDAKANYPDSSSRQCQSPAHTLPILFQKTVPIGAGGRLRMTVVTEVSEVSVLRWRFAVWFTMLALLGRVYGYFRISKHRTRHCPSLDASGGAVHGSLRIRQGEREDLLAELAGSRPLQ